MKYNQYTYAKKYDQKIDIYSNKEKLKLQWQVSHLCCADLPHQAVCTIWWTEKPVSFIVLAHKKCSLFLQYLSGIN